MPAKRDRNAKTSNNRATSEPRRTGKRLPTSQGAGKADRLPDNLVVSLHVHGRSEVVAVTGYSRSWIYELVWGYNRIGPETLGDQRSSNQGSSEPLLDDLQQALQWSALA